MATKKPTISGLLRPTQSPKKEAPEINPKEEENESLKKKCTFNLPETLDAQLAYFTILNKKKYKDKTKVVIAALEKFMGDEGKMA